MEDERRQVAEKEAPLLDARLNLRCLRMPGA
jgi:hypothetical protein